MTQENERLAKIYGPVETTRKNPYQKGTRYYDLYEANPYTDEKFTRQETFWDKIASGLGFRSGYDAAKEEWRKAAGEYDAQIAQLKSEDEYNSEAAKAQRMKEAGLNPDLLGTAGVSEAGEFAQEQTSPDINREPDSGDRIIGFAAEMIKGITFGLSISKDTLGIMGAITDNEGKKYDVSKRLVGLAKDFIDGYTPEKTSAGEQDKDKVRDEMYRSARVFAEQHNFSPKQRNVFADTVVSMIDANPDILNKRWKGNLENRRDYKMTAASAFTSTEDDNKDVMALISGYMQEIDQKLFWEATNKHWKEATEATEYQGLDVQAEIDAKNSENKARKETADMKINAKKSVNEVVKELGKYAERGNILAIVMQAIIPMVYTKYVGN